MVDVCEHLVHVCKHLVDVCEHLVDVCEHLEDVCEQLEDVYKHLGDAPESCDAHHASDAFPQRTADVIEHPKPRTVPSQR